MRDRAPHDDGVGQAGSGEVVDVAAVPGHEAQVFGPPHRTPDEAPGGHLGMRHLYGASAHSYNLDSRGILVNDVR